jgi:hypothetical protein
VIDVDVVVRSREEVPTAIHRLRARGYGYQGDKGMAGREAFLLPPGARPHHPCVVVDCPRTRRLNSWRSILQVPLGGMERSRPFQSPGRTLRRRIAAHGAAVADLSHVQLLVVSIRIARAKWCAWMANPCLK